MYADCQNIHNKSHCWDDCYQSQIRGHNFMDLCACVLLHRNLIHESAHMGIRVVSVILIRQKPSGIMNQINALSQLQQRLFSFSPETKLFWLTCTDKSASEAGGSMSQELKICLIFAFFPSLSYLNRRLFQSCKENV